MLKFHQVKKNASIDDTLKLIIYAVNEYYPKGFVQELTRRLREIEPSEDKRAFIKRVFEFVCRVVDYELDPVTKDLAGNITNNDELVWTPELTALRRKGDCKKMSTMIAAILKAAGIEPVLKHVYYPDRWDPDKRQYVKEDWTHIYVIVPFPDIDHYLTVDPVNNKKWNQEVPHKRGTLYFLNGKKMDLHYMGSAPPTYNFTSAVGKSVSQVERDIMMIGCGEAMSGKSARNYRIISGIVNSLPMIGLNLAPIVVSPMNVQPIIDINNPPDYRKKSEFELKWDGSPKPMLVNIPTFEGGMLRTLTKVIPDFLSYIDYLVITSNPLAKAYQQDWDNKKTTDTFFTWIGKREGTLTETEEQRNKRIQDMLMDMANNGLKNIPEAYNKPLFDKIVDTFKLTGFAAARLAFLKIIEANLGPLNLANKLAIAWVKNPEKVKSFWMKFEGDPAKLKYSIKHGAVSELGNRVSGPATMIGVTGVDDAVVGTTAAATAIPIVIEVVNLLKDLGVIGKKEDGTDAEGGDGTVEKTWLEKALEMFGGGGADPTAPVDPQKPNFPKPPGAASFGIQAINTWSDLFGVVVKLPIYLTAGAMIFHDHAVIAQISMLTGITIYFSYKTLIQKS